MVRQTQNLYSAHKATMVCPVNPSGIRRAVLAVLGSSTQNLRISTIICQAAVVAALHGGAMDLPVLPERMSPEALMWTITTEEPEAMALTQPHPIRPPMAAVAAVEMAAGLAAMRLGAV